MKQKNTIMQRTPRTPESYFNVPESIALLNIVKSDRIQNAFQLNRKNHASVWEMVANILSRFNNRKRSAKQCCNRYENLKKIYTQLKRNPEKHVRRNWPYMYLFREIEEQRGESWGTNSKRNNKGELSYYQRRRALMLMNDGTGKEEQQHHLLGSSPITSASYMTRGAAAIISNGGIGGIPPCTTDNNNISGENNNLSSSLSLGILKACSNIVIGGGGGSAGIIGNQALINATAFIGKDDDLDEHLGPNSFLETEITECSIESGTGDGDCDLDKTGGISSKAGGAGEGDIISSSNGTKTDQGGGGGGGGRRNSISNCIDGRNNNVGNTGEKSYNNNNISNLNRMNRNLNIISNNNNNNNTNNSSNNNNNSNNNKSNNCHSSSNNNNNNMMTNKGGIRTNMGLGNNLGNPSTKTTGEICPNNINSNSNHHPHQKDEMFFGLNDFIRIKEEPIDHGYEQENGSNLINNNYNGHEINENPFMNGNNERNILHPDVIVDTDHVTDSSSLSLQSKRVRRKSSGSGSTTDIDSTNYELIEYLKRREKRDQEMFRRMDEREERLINLFERTVVAIERIASHSHSNCSHLNNNNNTNINNSSNNTKSVVTTPHIM